jgi:hypothetical protein
MESFVLWSTTTLKLDNFDVPKKRKIFERLRTFGATVLFQYAQNRWPLSLTLSRSVEAREEHDFNGAISSIATRTKCFSVVIIQYSVYDINARSAKFDFEVRASSYAELLEGEKKTPKSKKRISVAS